jgi:hypothetical protein
LSLSLALTLEFPSQGVKKARTLMF